LAVARHSGNRRGARPVDTAMAKAVHTPEIRADCTTEHMPLNRYGLEEELAETIFLLSVQLTRQATPHGPGDRGRRRLRLHRHRLPTLRAEKRNG